MKHTNTNEFNNALKAYLEPIITEKAADYGEETNGNPYKWVVGIAKAEVPHEFRGNEQNGLCYWLSGLGLNIAFDYCDIIEIGETLHECTLTDKERDMVCQRWFGFISHKILQFANK